MKIIKFVATRCQILRLKCIKFDFGGRKREEGGEGRGGRGPPRVSSHPHVRNPEKHRAKDHRKEKLTKAITVYQHKKHS